MVSPILIIAHPGHELRLFGWIEEFRPLVCILTDGSGSMGPSRIEFSHHVLDACGTQHGPVMGLLPDRDWDAALLEGDPDPFVTAADLIANAASAGSTVVSDPVEGYNPMHDLASAVADRVARMTGGERMTFPLMRPAQPHQLFVLSEAAIQRKSAAITGYVPLANEAAALLLQHPDSLAVEMLCKETWSWPTYLSAELEYERIGRSRAIAGLYSMTITYGAHVLPIANRLGSASGLMPVSTSQSEKNDNSSVTSIKAPKIDDRSDSGRLPIHKSV